MAEYYINRIIDSRITKINPFVDTYGLFKNKNGWEGKGNFSGWYGAEFYKDTDLIAYGKQKGGFNNSLSDIITDDEHIKHYDEIEIYSIYAERKIEAESDEKAIELFSILQLL